jgi:hypothetical protein
MPMKPMVSNVLLAALGVCLTLASCAAPPAQGIAGPTGRAGDAGKLTPIKVRDVWKESLRSFSRDIVTKRLPLGSTAKFDPKVHFDGYYDSDQDVTRVAVYGNVTTSTDYGTVHNNGYYVIWENPGRVKTDFPPPWQLADVEITDVQY